VQVQSPLGSVPFSQGRYGSTGESDHGVSIPDRPVRVWAPATLVKVICATITRVTVSHSPTLVLWDIDHTLIDAGGVGRTLYEVAFRKVTGQPMRYLADMTGRTERAILTDTLELHGMVADEATLQACYDAMAEAVADLRPQIRARGRVRAGARQALDALAVEQAMQSVVTGNIRPVAVAKLEAFNLASYVDFAIGGYGSDGLRRAPLVRAARLRAAEKYGAEIPLDRIVVVGDTTDDIIGAREAGVRSVGVASGSSSIEQLRAAEPCAVLPDLTDLRALLAVIFP
jgi:phosphoglycolate phosphatase